MFLDCEGTMSQVSLCKTNRLQLFLDLQDFKKITMAAKRKFINTQI